MKYPVFVERTARDGVMLWFCLTCNRVADLGACGVGHEVAAIPPPPMDSTVN
jgi:hypothetical protein